MLSRYKSNDYPNFTESDEKCLEESTLIRCWNYEKQHSVTYQVERVSIK